MKVTKALEHKGVLYVADKPKDVNEFWFMAKSNNNENLARIWACIKKYGCEYDQDIMQKVVEAEASLHIQRLSI